MDSQPPNRDTLMLPEGAMEVTFAKNQPPYAPLPTIITPDGRIISQWTLNEDEKRQLVNGHPLTLVVHVFSNRCPNCRHIIGIPPVQLVVGEIVDVREP